MHNLYLRIHYVCELCKKCRIYLNNYKKVMIQNEKMAYINSNLKKIKKEQEKALQKGERMVI